ncbi:MAG TPA: hypothetical protein VKV25_07160 [Acidimicrobiales bacterium]|nr:hypothetical protein [Acidimicrobiales bacterium]
MPLAERVGRLMRAAPLPDARMVVLYPMVALAMVVLLAVSLATAGPAPHQPAGSRGPVTAGPAPTPVGQPATVLLPDIRGGAVGVPAGAVAALESAVQRDLGGAPTAVTVLAASPQSLVASVGVRLAAGASSVTVDAELAGDGTWHASVVGR